MIGAVTEEGFRVRLVAARESLRRTMINFRWAAA